MFDSHKFRIAAMVATGFAHLFAQETVEEKLPPEVWALASVDAALNKGKLGRSTHLDACLQDALSDYRPSEEGANYSGSATVIFETAVKTEDGKRPYVVQNRMDCYVDYEQARVLIHRHEGKPSISIDLNPEMVIGAVVEGDVETNVSTNKLSIFNELTDGRRIPKLDLKAYIQNEMRFSEETENSYRLSFRNVLAAAYSKWTSMQEAATKRDAKFEDKRLAEESWGKRKKKHGFRLHL